MARKAVSGGEITKNQLLLFQVQIAMTAVVLIIVLKRYFAVFFARLLLIGKLYRGFQAKI